MAITFGAGITLGQGISVTPSYEVVQSGLQLYLDAGDPASYPGSGSTWTDTVGADVFTLYNSPTYDSANGGSLVFDRGLSQFAQGASLPSSLTSWTVEAWLYNDMAGASGGSPCIVTEVYAGTPINFTLGPIADDFPNIQSASYNGGWANSGTTVLSNGSWHQVLGTWDGNMMSLYVDGNLVVQQTHPGFTSATSGQGIRLMRRWDADQYWSGKLAIVRIYNTALTAQQVNGNFNANKSRFGL